MQSVRSQASRTSRCPAVTNVSPTFGPLRPCLSPLALDPHGDPMAGGQQGGRWSVAQSSALAVVSGRVGVARVIATACQSQGHARCCWSVSHQCWPLLGSRQRSAWPGTKKVWRSKGA